MPHSDSQSDDDRVNEAIAEYLEAVERGETPDRKKFLAEHADIAAELDSFLGNAAEFKLHAGGSLESRLQAELGGKAPAKAGTPTPGNPSDPNEQTLNFPQRNIPSSRNVLRYFGDYELIEEIARGGMGVR